MDTSQLLFADPRVQKYESFLNERLKQDLADVMAKRDKIYEEISKVLQLRNQIEVMRKSNQKELKTRVNVGCDFFMQARIPDTSKIILKIGLNVFAEMTLDEALSFLGRREKHLEAQTEHWTARSAEIRAHIKLVMQAIQDLLALGPISAENAFREP